MNQDFYLQWMRNRDFVRENPSLTATNDVHVNTHCVQGLFITPTMHVLMKVVRFHYKIIKMYYLAWICKFPVAECSHLVSVTPKNYNN